MLVDELVLVGKAFRKLLGLSYCSRTLLQSFDAARSII